MIKEEQGTDLIDLRLTWREMAGGDFLASEATTASKQPRRSDLTSDLKSVTSITYISMCILLICFGPILRPLWWPQRPLQPPNGLRAQILPQIWKLWPKLHMLPCLFGLFRPFLGKSEKKIKKKEQSASTRVAGAPLPQLKRKGSDGKSGTR